MKISVIIPTYNRAALVEETVRSVLEQSFTDYEVIVVDDGSTDQTAQTLARFGNRIRYVHQQNGGVNNARNHALSLAQGEFIAVVDDDDLWQPYKLALQLQILERFPEVAFTFSNFAIYKNPDDVRPNGIQSWFPESPNWHDIFDHSVSVSELGNDFTRLIGHGSQLYFGKIYHASMAHYYVLPSSALFRRSMVPDGVEFIEHDPICGDWDFFARLSRDHPVAYLDHDTTFNRSHEDLVRLTRTAWKAQLEYRIDMLRRLYMQDEPFYREHKAEVDALYTNRLQALFRQQLLNGDGSEARSTLKSIRSHSSLGSINYLTLNGASYIPGLRYGLRLLRHLRG